MNPDTLAINIPTLIINNTGRPFFSSGVIAETVATSVLPFVQLPSYATMLYSTSVESSTLRTAKDSLEKEMLYSSYKR